tara:strand:- start:1739 stop:1996 length:258 start_codon:yes stop_codon:yes gene_type:complete
MADAMESMTQQINQYSIFKHPNENCLSYIEHAQLSLTLSGKLFVGSVKAFIHAVLPEAFKTSTSELVRELQHIIDNSGCNKIKDV